MTAPRLRPHELPGWPRMMGEALAAAYCGVSVNFFKKTYRVPMCRQRGRVLYDRRDLDKAIDALKGEPQSGDEWLGRLDHEGQDARH